jgi:hypothetical protein
LNSLCSVLPSQANVRDIHRTSPSVPASRRRSVYVLRHTSTGSARSWVCGIRLQCTVPSPKLRAVVWDTHSVSGRVERLRSQVSQPPTEIVRISLPLSSTEKSNRTSVAVCDATGDEMTPCAGVRCLLNRPPLGCERPLEGPGFDRLAERQFVLKAVFCRSSTRVGLFAFQRWRSSTISNPCSAAISVSRR